MKRLLRCGISTGGRLAGRAACAVTLFLALTAAAPMPPAVGDRAPDFTLRDQNGARVTLAAQHGKKVVLVFYRGYW